MQLHNKTADIFVPDASAPASALTRTTHLGIGAHPDDLEIIAFHGIAHCYASTTDWFTGIVVTDGAGSPRSGSYAAYSDKEMVATRREEQRRAASIGKYSLQLQLGVPSQQLAATARETVVLDLLTVLQACTPQVVYLHNIADAHATHVNTALAALEALRRLSVEQRPSHVYGVEVWRSLDWLPQRHRVQLATDAHSDLQQQLLSAHASQIHGGKRYDRAVLARQSANATFSASHRTDQLQSCSLAMNLAPLLADNAPSAADYLQLCLQEFRDSLHPLA